MNCQKSAIQQYTHTQLLLHIYVQVTRFIPNTNEVSSSTISFYQLNNFTRFGFLIIFINKMKNQRKHLNIHVFREFTICLFR